jgi:diguanylate cyclase (GGDEF)-like protein/PAS domain S-box-containing protein
VSCEILADLFPDIVDRLALGVVVQGRDGRIVLCNPAAERILGLSRASLLGRDSMDPRWRAIREDGQEFPGTEHPAMLTLADGQPRSGVLMGIIRPDGVLVWIEIDTAPIHHAPDARPEWVIASFSDISARRALESELRESEMRFRQLADNIDLVFWINTPDWLRVDYISPAYERIWQRPAAELLRNGMDWFEAVIEEDRPAVLEVIEGLRHGDWRSIVFPPYRILRPDGSTRWISARAFPIRDATGAITRVAGIAEDSSTTHEQQRHLEEMAHLDALTHLPNRTLLGDRMRQSIARGRRSGQLLAVCVLDLDGFKPVNDQLGHDSGDDLLVQLAGRLLQTVRAEDTVARLGGDEFVLLLGNLSSVVEVEDALTRVLNAIAVPFQLGDHSVRVSASIGVTLHPNDGGDADTLLRHADHAMYLAKEAGKNRFHLFNPALEIRDRENRVALQRIEAALRAKQFTLHYQPIVDCRLGKAVGVEALIRWRHPLLGMLSPDEFLPLIESHARLTLDIGYWAIEAAIAQADEWRAQGIDLAVSINVFPQQFRDPDFHDRITGMLGRHPNLPPARIALEIIESSALEDIVAAHRLMQRGAGLGIHYALDDFGTGYSSMTYLRRLPVRVLKIDQSFVRDMLVDPEDMAIVEAIIGLAGAFRHQVVAEGVETLEQIVMLAELGCNLIQGYALAKPMAPEAIPDWTRAFKPDPSWRFDDARPLTRDDFQLILAEVNHRHWLRQLLTWNAENGADSLPALDDHACAFGHWYHGDGLQRYGSLPEYTDAEPLHHAVHEQARRLVDCRGDAQARAQIEVDLLAVSESFVTHLARLRRAVVNDQSGRSPLKEVK